MGFIEIQDQKKEAALIGLAKDMLSTPLGLLMERYNAKKGTVSKQVTVSGELSDVLGLSPHAKIWAGINLSPRDKEGSVPSPSIAITDGECFTMYTVQFGRWGGARVSQLLSDEKADFVRTKIKKKI